MTLFLKYWKKQPLHPLPHLHSHHLGAHGLRLFIHLHYNYAPVTSNCGKSKQYATSHRQVAWLMFLPCFEVLFGLSKDTWKAKWTLKTLYGWQCHLYIIFSVFTWRHLEFKTGRPTKFLPSFKKILPKNMSVHNFLARCRASFWK